MQVVVKDKQEIHLIDGPRYAGAVVDLPEKVALRYLAAGAVERHETKVAREAPLSDAGAAEPLSASPAAQVSPKTTVNLCVSGAIDRKTMAQIAASAPRKRGRPPKASS